MKQTKNKRVVKAWAAFIHGKPLRFDPVGNGTQFQYPLFPTRREAKEFTQECHGVGFVLPVLITYSLPTPKRKTKR